VFLNSTDEIIEQRLRENVTRVLDQPDAYSEATLFVHSDCHDAIQQWLLDSGSFESIECEVKVTVDDQLSPGDCRVNFGNSGRLASFEEQLKLVSARLKQTVRDQLESPA
jgi:flagellar biosynthesis/type III secretory pathway protein FliH